MPAPPAAYATQSRVRGVQGLQRVRGALQGSPGLPFLAGRPIQPSRFGFIRVRPACFATTTTELGPHHSGTQRVTGTGWGRREGSPLPITALSLCGAIRLRASAPY